MPYNLLLETRYNTKLPFFVLMGKKNHKNGFKLIVVSYCIILYAMFYAFFIVSVVPFLCKCKKSLDVQALLLL